jgi:RimJ/RimL family protein N-acetyltransferase
MPSIKSIEIKELKVEHVPDLVKKLSNEQTEYLKYFTAFEFSAETFNALLKKAVNDKFFGIFFEKEIAGFYMLRGFDEGYEIPSYGVWISSRFSNKGLSKLTLYHAFSVCRINNIQTLMLKVHPENKVPMKLYESLGFKQTGFDEINSNFIYHKNLTK